MVRHLLLICVFVVFGCHRLKHYLIYVRRCCWLTLTPSQSYLRHVPSKVLFNAEVEKMNKYAEACAARRAHLHPYIFCGWFSWIWGQLFFEADCMQVEFSVGLKLCWGVVVDSCPIGFCNCASLSVVCTWFPNQMEKFGPSRWCCHWFELITSSYYYYSCGLFYVLLFLCLCVSICVFLLYVVCVCVTVSFVMYCVCVTVCFVVCDNQ